MIKINTFFGIFVVGLVLFAPLSSNASSTTFRFFGNDGIDLSNYYIYFWGSSPGSGPDDVEVGYTLSDSTIGSFAFNTGSVGNYSILTTNQLSLASLASVSISNLTASRMYISYGQFGEGIAFTNSSFPNYSAPSRFAGGVGASTPFQFLKAM